MVLLEDTRHSRRLWTETTARATMKKNRKRRKVCLDGGWKVVMKKGEEMWYRGLTVGRGYHRSGRVSLTEAGTSFGVLETVSLVCDVICLVCLASRWVGFFAFKRCVVVVCNVLYCIVLIA